MSVEEVEMLFHPHQVLVSRAYEPLCFLHKGELVVISPFAVFGIEFLQPPMQLSWHGSRLGASTMREANSDGRNAIFRAINERRSIADMIWIVRWVSQPIRRSWPGSLRLPNGKTLSWKLAPARRFFFEGPDWSIA
jgi:hypothetical protein